MACAAAGCAEPSRPPATLGLDPFYTRYVDAGGMPVVSSRRTPAEALKVARDIVLGLTAHRPDLHRNIVANGVRVAVMAPEEGTVDLPEQRHWRKPAPNDPRLTRCERKHYQERIGRLSDREYWNGRARGMAGRLTSGATEDLLGLPSSRYYGENILLHEFAHVVLWAIRDVDPALNARIERAYTQAKASGRWRDEYALTTVDEYWAEGTQFWFNSNKVATFDGQVVLSDADLARYDPALAAVLREAYGDRHHIPADRFHQHAARVPPGPLPKFTAEVC
ncbi:glycoside hydrolase [Sphingomonas lenta]|uniref:Glycoside hydrolase n=1 Tax=Sphingomonas lenta TaxID=1141887 RepID=A0A2A2SGS6_9SPHN|nr:glycoside hydrolase [Sphingomonas lenta]